MPVEELRKPYPLINIEKKFVLFTNAKCGGTTLKQWFVDSLELEQTFSNPLKAIRHFGISFISQWYQHYLFKHDVTHIKSANALLRRFIRIYREQYISHFYDTIENPAFYKFAIIRNPYDRLVSGFVDKFCGKDLKLDWTQRVLKEVNSVDDHGRQSITFLEFVTYLSSKNLEDVDPHWRHQWYILEKGNIDQFIKLENMSKELPILSKKLGVKMDITKKRQSNTYDIEHYADIENIFDIPNTKLIEMKLKYGGFPSKDAFYTDEIRASVARIYKADFDNLGYKK